jgi:hypothetical protein
MLPSPLRQFLIRHGAVHLRVLIPSTTRRLAYYCYTSSMFTTKRFLVPLVGALSTFLVNPSIVIAMLVDRSVEGCAGPYDFGCGFHGLVLVPLMYLAVACLALRALRIKHALAVPLISTAVLTAAYLMLVRIRFSPNLPIPAMSTLFALFGACVYAVTYDELDRRTYSAALLRVLRYRPPKGFLRKRRSNWLWLVLITISVGCAAPFVIISENIRLTADDEQTARDLGSIQGEIDSYYLNGHDMPSSLQEVAFNPLWYGDVSSRLSLYEYAATGKNSYKLCGKFHKATPSAPSTDSSHPNVYSHGSGTVCFDFSDTRNAAPQH